MTLRFQTLSLFLVAVGWIASAEPDRRNGGLLVGLTIGMWVLEARNRALSRKSAERALQIESVYWGYRNSDDVPYYATFHSGSTTELGWAQRLLNHIRPNISHSWALDIIFMTVMIYAVSAAV